MTITNGYCTLAQLKAEKGISDAIDDSILELAINAASRQIDGVTGWRFWQDGSATARTFFPSSPACVELFDDDDGDGISTTTGLIVKIDADDSGTYETTLTINVDFALFPQNALVRVPAWPYTQLRMLGTYWLNRSSYGRPTVQITAKWGWPAVPDDVTKACVIQAAQLAKAKDAVFGAVALGDMALTMSMRSAFNPLARHLLSPYTKPAVG